MHRYWRPLIRPICEATRAKVIVEVGAASGFHTLEILEFCRDRGGHAHIIDPVPVGNEEELRSLLDHGTIHRTTSLEALPGLEGDLFLVDGDHNWYTVYHELKLIEETARNAGRPMPILVCHDTSWPYGRRDLYYRPERIPAEFRQEHARRGMRPGRSELLPEGGFNRLHDNAVREGGPRNGVLTAIEDFVKESGIEWRMTSFPAFHGLTVLHVPGEFEGDVREELERLLDFVEPALGVLATIEEERLHVVTELMDTYRILGGKPGPRVASLVRAAKRLGGAARRILQPFRRWTRLLAHPRHLAGAVEEIGVGHRRLSEVMDDQAHARLVRPLDRLRSVD